MKFKLTVFLKDGRELSGEYDWLSVLTRLSFALKLPDFKSFALMEVA